MPAKHDRFDGAIADEHLLYEFEQTLATVAKIVGRKWNPVIVYVLLTQGPLGYATLQERIEGLSSKVLSESLLNLEENGLVDRAIVSEKPFRVEYSLTERGHSLQGVTGSMLAWGLEWLDVPVGEEAVEEYTEPPFALELAK
ncbi:winged helix-turn-helix transcriptional regulator [Halomarina litorea]|uniref:winged helix-turn-helix transcriptional regulator n=1 Tax=Halomarina litorea TaxID=2961595 RepID=UPI0020C2D62F|nr:helix-turn-helix domain-containing protein [Halomarina sp. BCD28]